MELKESESISRSVVSDSLQPYGYSSPPGSSVHGILWARILELVAIPFSRGSSNPGSEPGSSALWDDSLQSEPPGKPTLVDSETSLWMGAFLVLGGRGMKVGQEMTVCGGLCGGDMHCTRALWP